MVTRSLFRVTVIGAALTVAVCTHASVVTQSAFQSASIIDFNDSNPINTQIGAKYAAQGLASSTLCGGSVFQTGAAAASETLSNFYDPGCSSGVPAFGSGQMTFTSTISRVGFDITTNAGDDTTITAYLGNTLVGSEVFDTFGSGLGGLFAGIEFLSGFDRIVISALPTVNGAFSLDNLRFDAAATSVPEPGSLALLGLGLAGLAAIRKRKQA